MRISNIVVALVMVFMLACTGKKTADDQGHNHNTESHDHSHESGADEHTHVHDNYHSQEEFTVDGDSTRIVPDSTHHIHEDGSIHPNHYILKI
jgi:hypothetical protein